jgi:hypothetical protein
MGRDLRSAGSFSGTRQGFSLRCLTREAVAPHFSRPSEPSRAISFLIGIACLCAALEALGPRAVKHFDNHLRMGIHRHDKRGPVNRMIDDRDGYVESLSNQTWR